MARKKQEDAPPAGAPAWMATFGDLMNLLLCFFVLLFAMSSVEESLIEELAVSLSGGESFWDGSELAIDMGTVVNNGANQTDQLIAIFNEHFQNKEKGEENSDTSAETEEAEETLEASGMQESQEMMEQLVNQLSKMQMMDDVEVEANAKYVKISLDGAILFDSGAFSIKNSGLSILDKIGKILRMSYKDHEIEVVGYTDNQPVPGRPDGNRELSRDRAGSVETFFIDECNLDTENLRSSGRGENDPVASNNTAAGRAKNRRVEIWLHNSLNSNN